MRRGTSDARNAAAVESGYASPAADGCAGKAPPGFPGVGGGAGVTVTLDSAAAVAPSPAPYPSPKASIAAAPHTTIAVLPLWFVTVLDCKR